MEKFISQKQKLFNYLENYGIYYNEATEQLVANDIRQTQQKLSKQTNKKGLQYKDKVKGFLQSLYRSISFDNSRFYFSFFVNVLLFN